MVLMVVSCHIFGEFWDVTLPVEAQSSLKYFPGMHGTQPFACITNILPIKTSKWRILSRFQVDRVSLTRSAPYFVVSWSPFVLLFNSPWGITILTDGAQGDELRSTCHGRSMGDHSSPSNKNAARSSASYGNREPRVFTEDACMYVRTYVPTFYICMYMYVYVCICM